MPGCLVAPQSWRAAQRHVPPNEYLMTPATRTQHMMIEVAKSKARKEAQRQHGQVARREDLMRNTFPDGVIGIDAPVEGSKIYGAKAKALKAAHLRHTTHARGRRHNLALHASGAIEMTSTGPQAYNLLAHM